MKPVTVIFNPAAGRGKARRLEATLRKMLDDERCLYSFERTEGPGHATELAEKARHASGLIIAAGGDGTAHEIAVSLIESATPLGVLPIGSGNDLARVGGSSKDLRANLRGLLQGEERAIDVGRVHAQANGSVKEHSIVFINSLGIGFAAIVANESRRIRWVRGLPLYVIALLNAVRKLGSYDFELTLDGERRTRRLGLLSVGNSPYEGGGFLVNPHAIPDDGIFDICTIDEATRGRVLRLFPKVITGEHGRQREVQFARAKQIIIRSDTPFGAHADGEIVGMDFFEMKVEILPRALSLRTIRTPTSP
ncbi:MAG: diacylglycerol/lipid kinase family protein [Bacteroidota bacterium]